MVTAGVGGGGGGGVAGEEVESSFSAKLTLRMRRATGGFSGKETMCTTSRSPLGAATPSPNGRPDQTGGSRLGWDDTAWEIF